MCKLLLRYMFALIWRICLDLDIRTFRVQQHTFLSQSLRQFFPNIHSFNSISFPKFMENVGRKRKMVRGKSMDTKRMYYTCQKPSDVDLEAENTTVFLPQTFADQLYDLNTSA
uniref:Putative ovule protein n=1 Tax=Solanum chacoense TaxID=4108 RepID=A0A0V0HKK0_SOLCH